MNNYKIDEPVSGFIVDEVYLQYPLQSIFSIDRCKVLKMSNDYFLLIPHVSSRSMSFKRPVWYPKIYCRPAYENTIDSQPVKGFRKHD